MESTNHNFPQLSRFSGKYLDDCGILQLMADLGEAVRQPGAIMLGGGNPSHIKLVQSAFRDQMLRILDSDDGFERLVGDYAHPAGDREFINSLVDYFRQEFGWEVSAGNIALTNGSQTAFFFLFNMLAGTYPNGLFKKILLPLAPEYIGYQDAGIDDDIFISYKPQIEELGEKLFKYRVDFDALQIDDAVGAICVSRPTNPTGNVLTEREIEQLSQLAQSHNIPLIIDNAYGMPFPGIIFREAAPSWEQHIVMCMSLSKLGLPGTRTGIVVAHQKIIQGIAGMNAVISLSPNNLGAALVNDLIKTGEIDRLSRQLIQPHYRAKMEQAVRWAREALAGLPYRIHKPEGAFFLWLWFPDLPISSQTLYQRLKARNVIIVPGHHFFPGLAEDWRHKEECIRVSYAQPAEKVQQGLQIIAEEVRRAHEHV